MKYGDQVQAILAVFHNLYMGQIVDTPIKGKKYAAIFIDEAEDLADHLMLYDEEYAEAHKEKDDYCWNPFKSGAKER